MLSKLQTLYGEQAKETHDAIRNLINAYKPAVDRHRQSRDAFSERDCVLITYGDFIQGEEAPLILLRRFALDHLQEAFNTIHILPFFPFESDRGFSIKDYTQVDPALGTWHDITALSQDFRLMYDFVLNHMSCESEWFERFAEGDPEYANFFMAYDEDELPTEKQLAIITRPRTTSLFKKSSKLKPKPKYLLQTFVGDQFDLDYREPKVLLKMTEILLLYLSYGCSLIRLDAVAFLWKRFGTTCVHLDETHAVVKLFREILEEMAPHVLIVTETNVPHKENTSYFGKDYDEAHMVYNFTLPPLTLYTFMQQNAHELSKWASSKLDTGSDTVTFFNFLDSHDGIGLRGIEGILPSEDFQLLADQTRKNGGEISERTEGDEIVPYELNTTWWSFLHNKDESLATNVSRYIASRAIALSLAGIPGIYLHGLLGSENDREGYEVDEHNRDINRKNLDFAMLQRDIAADEKTRMVFGEFIRLLKLRREQKAFHPQAEQKILDLDHRVFCVRRGSGSETIHALINVSDQTVEIAVPTHGTDLISNEPVHSGVSMQPYQVMWVKT